MSCEKERQQQQRGTGDNQCTARMSVDRIAERGRRFVLLPYTYLYVPAFVSPCLSPHVSLFLSLPEMIGLYV